jgi:peptidyl-tRNA hydrolase
MNFRKLLAGLLLSASTLAVSAAEPEAKKPAAEKPEAKKPAPKSESGGKAKARAQAERVCALTITWWEEPALAEGERLELGVQGDNGVTPIAPSSMSPSGTILYEGPAAVAIVRKGTMPDPSGKPGAKPIETWFPFVNFNLGPDDREALAILFSVDGTRKVMTRTFNINTENFPFGGFHVYNFSKTKLLCSMGGKVFYAEPGKRTASPVVMTQREVVNFFLGMTDADGVQKLIFRAPLILNEKIRRLYFVVDNPGAETENRFTTHTMMQHVAGHRTIESMRGQDTPKPAEADVPKAAAKKSEGSGDGASKPKAQ